MIQKIKLWWHYDAKHWPKSFVTGIKNLWKWFPVIWKDRDYDSAYIYRMLQFKLEQQAYGMSSRDRHVSTQRDVELMLLCARLCYIQQEESYADEYLDYVERKHEFVATDETKRHYTVESTVVKDNLDEYFALYPRQYKRALQGKIAWWGDETDAEDRTALAVCIAWDNQERSRRLLFKILDQRIGDWWD